MKPHKDGNLKEGHKVMTNHHNKPHPHLDPAHKSGHEKSHKWDDKNRHTPENSEYAKR